MEREHSLHAFCKLPEGLNFQAKVAAIRMFHPQAVIVNIIHVIGNWKSEINLKEMEPGYDENRLQAFCCQNPNGTPSLSSCTILRRSILLEQNLLLFLGRSRRTSKGQMVPLGSCQCWKMFSMPLTTGIEVSHIFRS